MIDTHIEPNSYRAMIKPMIIANLEQNIPSKSKTLPTVDLKKEGLAEPYHPMIPSFACPDEPSLVREARLDTDKKDEQNGKFINP